MRRGLRQFVCAALAATVLGGSALRAQDGVQPEELTLLREHYRPALHPADPLRIVGLEQDGKGPRARMPLLARGEHEPQQVDAEASYQRALGLYGGTLYRVPLRPASGAGTPATKRPYYFELEPEPEERGPAATPWSVLAGLSVSVLLLVWFFVRVRPALVAPYEILDSAQPEAEAAPEEFVFRPTRRAPATKFARPR